MTLFLCATGNTYPITRTTDYDDPNKYDKESFGKFHDKALKSGYDSHYIPIGTHAPIDFQCSPSLATADVEERVFKEKAQLYPFLTINFRTKDAVVAKPL